MITYFRKDMKGKEGSGIQKYTESPVTSRSISEKDMTIVYIFLYFFHNIKKSRRFRVI